MNTNAFDDTTRKAAMELAQALVDQERARVIVPAERPEPGFWFGGGNLSVGPDGALYLVGRYRNYGDSRTGLGRGERGKELAVFRSDDRGATFRKVLSLSKSDLSLPGREVLSIEGSHLEFHENGVSLYVSTEKDGIGYPDEVRDFHKSGTGVWTIDVLHAPSVDALGEAAVEPLLASRTPEYLHVKDPFVFTANGTRQIGFCTHPFCWSASHTGFHVDGRTTYDVFPRGPAWDVAIARMTCYAPLPRIGRFAAGEQLYLCFYDGGECVRQLDEHPAAVARPRGYSCEEIGGLALARDSALLTSERLSTLGPAFVSPHGTGCSRYVDVLFTEEYAYATWQQSQDDLSQPLVMNVVEMSTVAEMLGLRPSKFLG